MLRTRLTEALGIEVPIITAPMGLVITGPQLAAAVSNVGGLGVMNFGASPPALLRERVRCLRGLTDRPFGVGFIVPMTEDEQVAVCIEERVPVLWFFWGDPSPWIERAHAAGLRVFQQVGSVAAARDAARAGVDVVVAQGYEAGGHVAGQVTTMVLVPRVVDAIAPTPVVAAGGIADGRGVVAALALGAEAVVLGTRLLATPEAGAHPRYKDRVLQATEEDTVHTLLFGGGWPDAPHRTLRTGFVREWLGREARGQEERPDEPVIAETDVAGQRIPVSRFAALPPMTDTTGDIDAMALYAGQSAGLVSAIEPAADVVRRIVDEARQIIAGRLADTARARPR
jgi:NAD(P)H-dependent flavin oxidoreductase YrpB (nitropropane dioxygenase family)